MTLRNLAIWGVIGLVLVGLYGVLSQGQKNSAITEMSYSQLLAAVDAGTIRTAVITGDRVDAKDVKNRQIMATTPANQDELVKRMEAAKADIKVKPANQITIWSVLF